MKKNKLAHQSKLIFLKQNIKYDNQAYLNNEKDNLSSTTLLS